MPMKSLQTKMSTVPLGAPQAHASAHRPREKMMVWEVQNPLCAAPRLGYISKTAFPCLFNAVSILWTPKLLWYIWDLISYCSTEKVILKHHAYRGVKTYDVNRSNMKETDCVFSSRWLCYKQTQVWFQAMQTHVLFSQDLVADTSLWLHTEAHFMRTSQHDSGALFHWRLGSTLFIIPVVPVMDQGFKHFASVKGSLGT